jgi:outer membrane beta-barrel protein
MRHRPLACLLFAASSAGVFAQTGKADEPVVVPQVDRRDVKPPRLPSNDFEAGLFVGSYAAQNFGTSLVGGVRLGYHITEDVFVEGVYAQTKVSDESFRQIFPGGGIFPSGTEKLSYYNLSAGYNVMPGEVFFGKGVAKASSFYLIGGIGSTTFFDQRKQTINFGFGTRVLFNDHFAAQADVRDHVFSLDLLGKSQSTQNLEVTFGLTVFF